MTVYGPATGNYSSGSIRQAKKNNNAKAGDQIINGKFIDNTNGTNNGESGSSKSKQSSMVSDIQKAFEAKNKALQDSLNTQLGDIKSSSDDNRSDAYVNSRLSAIGNNEQLANQGLAGNLYGSNLSGISESSRIKQDTTLQNNINSLNEQQTSLETQAKNTVGSQIADNQLQMAQTIAQLRQQERESQKAEYANTVGAYSQDYQAEINRLKAMGYTDDDYEIKVLNQARQQKISGINQSKAEAEQQAFENQLKLMSAMKSSGGSGGGSSSNYYKGLPEPDMTLPQAKDAFEKGVRTKEVVDAYDYYFGTIYGKDPTTTIQGVSNRSTKKVFDEFGEKVLGKDGTQKITYGGTATNIDNDLQSYTQAYMEGRITLERLKEILKKYGYGTDGENIWITD